MAKNIQEFDDVVQRLAERSRQPDRIERISIIGFGVMGRGIAQIISAAGIEVLALERDAETLQASIESLSDEMNREIQRWAMTESEKKAILSRIRTTIQLGEVEKSDIVIEAVDEDFALKKKIFKELDSTCKPEAIFVSNTSTLSLTKIAEATLRPDKIIGMHFLNPVTKVRLVELVRGLKTSDETFNKVKQFAEALGKTVIEIYEYPGFVTTRVILPMLNEAMHVLMEGVASAKDIDIALKLGYNLPVGPLEMADSMGLDEVHAWMETLFHELGDLKYRPCPLLRRLVREGKLGKKTGEGFFKYNELGKKI